MLLVLRCQCRWLLGLPQLSVGDGDVSSNQSPNKKAVPLREPLGWDSKVRKALNSERVEQQIREETVELDHDSSGEREPDGGENRCGGEELLHGCGSGSLRIRFWSEVPDQTVGQDSKVSLVETASSPGLIGFRDSSQRGETVIFWSASVSLPPVSSLKAASGQVAEAIVALRAIGRSIWISSMVASLRPATAWR